MMAENIKHLQEDPELRLGNHFHTRHAHKYVAAYLFVVVLLVVAGATYAWQHKKVKLETARVQTLQTQLEAAQKSYNAAVAARPKQ